MGKPGMGGGFLCRVSKFQREERGQSLIETAISLSVLILFVFMFIEVCLAFYSYGMISESAREGSRYASMHGSTCVTPGSVSCTANAASINSYVSTLGYPNLAGGTMNVNTTFSPSGTETPGSQVTVAVTYSFPITLALVPQSTWTISTSSTMTILQ